MFGKWNLKCVSLFSLNKVKEWAATNKKMKMQIGWLNDFIQEANNAATLLKWKGISTNSGHDVLP